MTTEIPVMVRRLADRFKLARPDDLVTYDDLSMAIGQDVLAVRHYIYAAMELANREVGATFKTVHKQGYQRLRTDELTAIGQSIRKKVRRQTRRGNKQINAALRHANDVTPEQHRAILREQSVLGLLEDVARDKSLPQMENEVQPLTPAQTARQFLERMGVVKRE